MGTRMRVVVLSGGAALLAAMGLWRSFAAMAIAEGRGGPALQVAEYRHFVEARHAVPAGTRLRYVGVDMSPASDRYLVARYAVLPAELVHGEGTATLYDGVPPPADERVRWTNGRDLWVAGEGR